MSCQKVPTTPAFNPYPRSVQVGEFEVAIGGGIWVAIRDGVDLAFGKHTTIDPMHIVGYNLEDCYNQDGELIPAGVEEEDEDE